jgi:Protein of unknown function (DUF1236)
MTPPDQETIMRKTSIILAAVIATAMPVIASTGAFAQSSPTRAEEQPGAKPIEFLNAEQQGRMRTYMRTQNRASVVYNGELRVGTILPNTVTAYRFEGDPTLSSYRYVRLNNRDVIVDETGRIIDINEASPN